MRAARSTDIQQPNRWSPKRYFQAAGGIPRLFIKGAFLLREPSIFVDESGSQGGHSRYCLVTLLMHDQDDSIAENIASYEEYNRTIAQGVRGLGDARGSGTDGKGCSN